MSTDSNAIFKPFLASGIIVLIFGALCIWMAQTIQQREGEGFWIIGWRFLIGGIILTAVAFVARHFKNISKQVKYLWKMRKGSKYDDLYKP
jgi:uncharacterized membrane protein YvlD (DUF360 family)